MLELLRQKRMTKWCRFKQWLRQLEVKIAFKTAIAAGLSLILGVAFNAVLNRPEMLMSGLWCVMASIVVMQVHLGGTYQAAWIRFLGVFVGSIAGVAFASLIGNDALSLSIGVFFTILICSILNIKDSFRIASLSTAVIIIFAGTNPTADPWHFGLFRFLDSCIGIVVAVTVAHLVWPEKAVKQLHFNLIKILGLMSKYYRLSVDLEEEIKPYEQSRETLFFDIEKLFDENRSYRENMEIELRQNEAQRNKLNLLTTQLEDIFELIFTLKNVHKDTLLKMFDDSLSQHVAKVIDLTDMAFHSLEKMITEETSSFQMEELEQSIIALNAELLRFRETHTTRKFNLTDVESFFVFFYSLRAIAENTIKMIIMPKNI